MKLLFISTNRLRRVMPPMPLGLASIIGQLDDTRHEIRVLDLMFSEQPETDLKAVLSEFDPNIIAISVRNVDNQSYLHTEYLLPQAKEVVALCRANSDATIVVGGSAFTVSPVAIFDYLEPDFGVVGEGEIVFRELVDRIEKESDCADLPGLVWREEREQGSRMPGDIRMNPRRHIEDLDSLRPPRREFFDNQRYAAAGGFANVIVKQGCGFRCLYCDGPYAMGRGWRKKSPERVADEVESLEKDLGVTVAYFSDAIFNYPVEHAKEVCRAIIRRNLGVHWATSFHPAFADRQLVELMREAGCSAISLGCDTCSEKMLKVLRKGFTKEHLGAAMDMFEEMEINYILSLLIGGPGENRQTVEESVAFLKDRRPFMLDFCVGIRLMPGTALREIAVQEGVISANDPLMEPRFYISRDVKDWVADYLLGVCSEHSNWTVAHIEP
ncbi:radical SAM protein [Candidatus Poribacteria bacterium]|nr:radical SAM protein [Candidatus Poribacteria bacterium]